jgi:hypothetical protein
VWAHLKSIDWLNIGSDTRGGFISNKSISPTIYFISYKVHTLCYYFEVTTIRHENETLTILKIITLTNSPK